MTRRYHVAGATTPRPSAAPRINVRFAPVTPSVRSLMKSASNASGSEARRERPNDTESMRGSARKPRAKTRHIDVKAGGSVSCVFSGIERLAFRLVFVGGVCAFGEALCLEV